MRGPDLGASMEIFRTSTMRFRSRLPEILEYSPPPYRRVLPLKLCEFSRRRAVLEADFASYYRPKAFPYRNNLNSQILSIPPRRITPLGATALAVAHLPSCRQMIAPVPALTATVATTVEMTDAMVVVTTALLTPSHPPSQRRRNPSPDRNRRQNPTGRKLNPPPLLPPLPNSREPPLIGRIATASI